MARARATRGGDAAPVARPPAGALISLQPAAPSSLPCIHVGCDPGLEGAVAVLDPEGRLLDAYSLPLKALQVAGKRKRTPCFGTLWESLLVLHLYDVPIHGWIEDVTTHPRDGRVGAFWFGRGVSTVHDAFTAARIPYSLVAPNKWKGQLRCPADKGASKARATELLPGEGHRWPGAGDAKSGLAEAAMLAFYGRVYGGGR